MERKGYVDTSDGQLRYISVCTEDTAHPVHYDGGILQRVRQAHASNGWGVSDVRL